MHTKEPARPKPRRRRRSATVLLSLGLLAGTLSTTSPAAQAQDAGDTQQEELLPIVFVHGGAGSGAQYESQAMRFASNGYPADLIRAFDYNSLGSGEGTQSTDLDAFIDDVRAEFGVDQVHTAGHSLGTLVMGTYLSDPEQAAKVASYASLDGAPATCTGENAPNCATISAASMGQTHVEAATSPESFARQYELFTGEPPATTDIVPEDGPIELAGRAVNFPANTGADGATLEVWETDWHTGQRTCGDVGPNVDCDFDAVARFELGPGGEWGPFEADPSKTYEFALIRDGVTIHYYLQRFPRSDYLIRLNASPPDSAISENTNRGPDHTSSTVVRYREWWTDHESGNNDVLAIYTRDGSGQVVEEPVPVLENVTGNSNIGIHIHDDEATPQETSLELLPFFPEQVFQTGVDVFMPAGHEPGHLADGIVSFVNAPRGQLDMASWQVVNTPNWNSDTDHVIVQFNDYVQ